MAYFSDRSDGMLFEEQCSKCRYEKLPCPIYFVQFEFNYKAVNNPVATEILNNLVKDNGACMMFKMFEKEFKQKSNLKKKAKNLIELHSIEQEGLIKPTPDEWIKAVDELQEAIE